VGEGRGLFFRFDYPHAMAELLEQRLKRQFPTAKQTTLRRMLRDGRVRINGTTAQRMKQPIGETDKIEVISLPPPSRPIPSVHPLKIVFEDDDLLIVNKPAGLLTSTVPREKRPTALAILRNYTHVGLIHRLDRDAAGLLVFSKTDLAHHSLKRQFFLHTVQRTYIAVTDGVPTPAAGRIESRLVELPDGSVRPATREGIGELAVTEYQTIQRQGSKAVVRATLHTGRKHQIRVHLSQRGAPIVGDSVYNPDRPGSRLMLAAVVLGFVHPRTGHPVLYELQAPKYFPIIGGRKLSQT
jgi:23S rRNA pseudouridine1911/1915/1917 synthase